MSIEITPDTITSLAALVVAQRLDRLELPGLLVITRSQHDAPPTVTLGAPKRPRPSKAPDLAALPPEELLGHASRGGRRSAGEEQALADVGREIDEQEAGRG